MKKISTKTTPLTDIVKIAAEVINNGGIVIYPTETCYGVGVDATNNAAVSKLLKYKKRPPGKAISAAVADRNMAEMYVEINDDAETLYKTMLPGPVTVISKSKGVVDKRLVSEKNTLGIRIPDYPLIREIIKASGKPITATSANSAGKKTPYKIQDCLDNLSSRQKSLVDLIIDAGELPHNPPSVVVDTTTTSMQILRRGGLDLGRKLQEIVIESAVHMQQQGHEFIGNLTEYLKSGFVVVLFHADLGAGKTQFIKGVAEGLGIKENVNSPTFTLVKEYDYRLKEGVGQLIHMDAWRLENIAEFAQLGIEKYLSVGNVLAVEWGTGTVDYFRNIAASTEGKYFEIEITYTAATQRLLKIFEG